ncbi:MAG: sensor histidine kinase [Eubacteriales bacterium]|jgi:signal transduction histidine kinase
MLARTGKNLLLLLILLLVSILAYTALFRIDNKYTAALTGGYGYSILQNDPDQIGFLVDGWEFYPGELLEPADFRNQAVSPSYVYIGEHPNFSHFLDSPYGVATYRLVLINNGAREDLALYLPELLCSGRIYINGRLIGEQGSPDPYTPWVKDGLYSFTAGQNTEIIIQCANYTHYYSGMYYPPAVGSISAIFRMIAARLMVYGLLCFSSLAIALHYLKQWVLSRDKPTRWIGLLSLTFALRTCYPFLRALGVPSVRLLYALEDVCGNVVLLCAILLAGELSDAAARWYHRRVAIPAAVGLCVFTGLFPVFILPYTPNFINSYGLILFLWKLAVSLYLIFLSIGTAKPHLPLERYLLFAAGFYGLSLGASVLLANRLEPIWGAWPEEYGGFALVIGFAAMMGRRNILLSLENRRLTLHLQEEVDRKTQGMALLLKERRELLANLLHDLKNPLAALYSYAELVRQSDVTLDAETARYVDALTERVKTVGERVELLQDFSRGERGLHFEKHLCLNDFLRTFYETNQPDMELSGVKFSLKLPMKNIVIRGDPDRLQTVLENLCYNALSFTPPDGVISLALAQQENFAVISVKDTGSGIAPEDLPHIFKRGFTHRSDNSGDGLGLFLARTIVLEHGGSIDVVSQLGQGSTFTLQLPVITAP